MSFNIEVQAGTTARLLVGGKYCDRDIVVTATGGTFDGIYVNDRVTSLSNDVFRDCAWLKGISCDNISSIGPNAFDSSGVTFAELPKLKEVSGYAFRYSQLERINAPSVTNIYTQAFYECRKLSTVILGADNMVNLLFVNAFDKTPIADGTGYIYVPSALVESYKADSSWSTYKDQIRAIEDHPEICGAEN